MRMLSRMHALLGAAAALLAGAAAPSRAGAQEMEVPVALQVPLFLKVMTFDRQLVVSGGELVVAVAYQGGFRASAVAKDEVVRALGAFRAGEWTVRVEAIDIDRLRLGAALERCGAAVLYVAPLRAVDIAALAAAAREARVTTVTGVPRYVSLGLAVGARLQGDRPKLLINVEAARLEGASFTAELLKLAQVLP